MNAINCLCQKGSEINEESAWEDVWEELKNLHSKCAAVKFLIPDFESWFKDNKEPEKTAFHQSTLVLAFRRGHLDRITSPIHRYCLSNNNTLTNQYKKDLSEAWVSCADSSERHKKFRIWMGKMTELKVAEWLEVTDWKIEGMEAWGGKNDIKAKNPDNEATLIEVKYIGQNDEDFKHLVAHLAGGSAVQSLNPYVAFNYVLFRIFEATYQFINDQDSMDSHKEVSLVIDSSTWNSMLIPLKDWMRDNNRYRFFEEEVGQDIDWCNFYRKKIVTQKNIKKYGDDLFDMHNVIKVLNKITVFKMTDWLLEQKMSWTPPATLTP